MGVVRVDKRLNMKLIYMKEVSEKVSGLTWAGEKLKE